jgi:oligopeptide transport system ATP-binding protein
MHSGTVRAVAGISFSIDKGDVVGIVGESGCGKSALALSLMRLVPCPPGEIRGSIVFDGIDITNCSAQAIRGLRGNRMSMVFQDPLTSLNPYMRIVDQLAEPLEIHKGISKKNALPFVTQALDDVGIGWDKRFLNAYPHEFSGGMRQRVMIAMGLITGPDLLIADEPTTALDVTVQAQVLALLEKAIVSRNMAVLFITHNLGIVAKLCRRVMVMYAGHIVEQAETHELFYHTAHPYTRALINALPSVSKHQELLATIPGQPPDLSRPQTGCVFAPRCVYAEEKCAACTMQLQPAGKNHTTSCIRILDNSLTL